MFQRNSPLRFSSLAASAEATSLSLSRSAEFKKAHMTVKIISGKDLAPKDKGGTSDPYVVISTDRASARTSTRKKTLDPTWDEEFTFNLSNPSGKIHLSVWDKDRFKSDDFMGQADVFLEPDKSVALDQWVTLEHRKPDEEVSGQIHISVVYEVLLAEITLDDFEILTLVGEGSFGKVYQVRKKDTGQIYAMKALKKKMLIDEDEVEHTKAERDILISNNHPFLINMKFSFQNETRIFFVLDFVNGGELFFHLKKMKRFTEEMIRFYAAEITLLLIHLHALGIIYRDLKPENLLVEPSGHIKLTDFGLSKMSAVKGRLVRANTFCGTPEYLAPEVLNRQEYGTEVDWWCLGNLLFEMLTGFPPFYEKDTNKMYNKIKTSEVSFPSHTSPELKDLINRLLDKDPDTRLTDETTKQHPFFKNVNWEKVLQKRVKPPFVPKVSGETDISNVDKHYLNQETELKNDVRDLLTQSMDNKFGDFGFVRGSEVSSSVVEKKN